MDYICHGVIRPYLSSERTAARDHCKALECLGFLKGAVLIFDRGYYSAEMFRYFSENGYSCVMRLKEGINLPTVVPDPWSSIFISLMNSGLQLKKINKSCSFQNISDTGAYPFEL